MFTIQLRQEKWVSNSSSLSPSKIPMRRKSSASHKATMSRRVSTLNVKAMVGQMEKQARKQQQQQQQQQGTSSDEAEGEWVVLHSKLHFVDLASPPILRTKSLNFHGNKRTLVALGNVIAALSDPSKDILVNYHDSKLTELLQDSLLQRTVLIACISPAQADLDATLKTLQFVCRARNIRPVSNPAESERWKTSDNPIYLRSVIAKLLAESMDHHSNDSTSSSSSSSSSSTDSHRPRISSSARTTITIPDEGDSNQQLADLQRQIEELQNQVTMTRERNEFVEKELGAARSQAEQTLAGRIEAYASLKDAEKESLEQLKTRLANYVRQKHAIRHHIAKLEQQLDAAIVHQPDLVSLKESIMQLKTAGPIMTTDDDDNSSALEQQQQQTMKKLTDEIQEKTRQIEDLTARLTEAEKLYSELQRLRDSQAAQIKSLEQMLSNVRNEREQHRQISDKALQGLAQQLQESKQDLMDARSQNKQLRDHIWQQEQGTQITLRLRLEELERVKLELQSLQVVEEKQNRIIYTLEQKLDKVERLACMLREQVADKDKQIASLEQINAQQAQHVQELEQKLGSMLREFYALDMERKTLLMMVDYLDKTLKQQDDKLERATEETSKLEHLCKTKEAEHRAVLEKISAEKDQLLQDAAAGQEELDRMRKELTELQDQKLQSDIDVQRAKALESRIIELDEEIEELTRERDELLAKVQDKEKQLREAALDRRRSRSSGSDTSAIVAELETKVQELQRARKEDQEEFEARFERAVEDLERTRKTSREQSRLIESLQTQLEEAAAICHKRKSRQIQTLQLQEQALTGGNRHHNENEQPLPSPDLPRSISLPGTSAREAELLRRLYDKESQLRAKDATLALMASTLSQLQDENREALDAIRKRSSEVGSINIEEMLSRPDELAAKINQLLEDNAQLISHVDDLEGQLAQTKSLELEIMRLASVNTRLEKDVEHRSSSGSMVQSQSAFSIISRETSLSTPPPRRAMSPPPPGAVLHRSKIQRDSFSGTFPRMRKSNSHRIAREESEDDVNTKRMSGCSVRSASRSRNNTTSIIPPPTAPPSNPLPSVPSSAAGLPASPSSPHPSRSMSSPLLLHRQNSYHTSTSSIASASDITIDSESLTSERYEKIIRVLQRKIRVAESDVRAHQDVISKLESQLSRSEGMVREVKRQLDLLSREKQASSLEIQNLRSQVTQAQSVQQSVMVKWAEEQKVLQEQLEKERKAKEKAEKARIILENRMEELMTKKHKFMCF